MAKERDIQNVLQAENLFCERDNRVLFKDLNFTAQRGQVFKLKDPTGVVKLLCLESFVD